MALQAKYDPQEDRMRLTLHADEGKRHVFWVTRRDWLGLLHTLTDDDAMGAPPATGSAAGGTAGSTIATGAGRALRRAPAGDNDVQPIPLQGIRLRRLADGVKLVFVTPGQGVGIKLPATGVAQLQAVLQQQAERAGWDTAAALARLNAHRLTRAAMKKASRT